MRCSLILSAGLVAATGCVLFPKGKVDPNRFPSEDIDLYHVRLIRPGMRIEEVKRIVGFQDPKVAVGTLTAKATADRCGIIVDFTNDGKVIETQSDIQVAFGYGASAAAETDCLNRLRFGMSPAEVEKQIGPPKYGFENQPGTIVLIYDSRPGLEIVYVDQKAKSWRRTHAYMQSQEPPLAPGLANPRHHRQRAIPADSAQFHRRISASLSGGRKAHFAARVCDSCSLPKITRPVEMRLAMLKDRILSAPAFQIPANSIGWQPLLDIYELRDGWLLKADLAGVRPNEVTVTLSGRRVTIRGFRRDWSVEEGCSHYRMEIAYSRFERTIELPNDPEPATVQTEFREGMLLIRIRRVQSNP